MIIDIECNKAAALPRYYTGVPVSAPHTRHVYRVSSGGCPSERSSGKMSPPVCLTCPGDCRLSDATFSTKYSVPAQPAPGFSGNFSFSFWLEICRDHHQPGLTVRQDLEAVLRLPWSSQLRLLAAFPLTR